jgi:hypothetical protein
MALPDYSQGGFYNPKSSYPGLNGSINPRTMGQGTAMPNMYQNWATDNTEAQQGEWQHRLSELGLGGLGPRDKAAQNLYSQAKAGYAAAQTKNIELMWPEYLDTLDIGRLVAGQSYDQQGIKGPRKYRWGQRGV